MINKIRKVYFYISIFSCIADIYYMEIYKKGLYNENERIISAFILIISFIGLCWNLYYYFSEFVKEEFRRIYNIKDNDEE